MQNRLLEKLAGNIGHYGTLLSWIDRYFECLEMAKEGNN